MKVTCQSCQAKYTIADEKVRGKVAKIRCKKCGTTIVVDGMEPGAPRESFEAGAQSAGVAPAPLVWTLRISEADQRTVDSDQLQALVAEGQITRDTLAWSEGMDDWRPMKDVPALAEFLTDAMRATMNPVVTDHAPDSGSPTVQVAAMSHNNLSFPTPAAPVQRRASARTNADLFGRAALAGGEQDQLTHAGAASARPSPGVDGGDRPTGARNENSVLFSLSSLTGAPTAAPSPSLAPRTSTNTESSTIVDLQRLVRPEISGGNRSSRIDDIMHLGGGGVFSPSLAAPSLAAVAEAPRSDQPQDGAKKSKGLLFGALGVVALLAVGGVVFASMDAKTPEAPAKSAEVAPPSTPEARKPVDLAQPAPTAVAEPEEKPSLPDNERAVTPGGAPVRAAAPAPVAVAPGSPRAAADTERASAPKTLTKVEPTERPKTEKPAVQAPPQAAAEGASFDRAAALSTLGAAATSAQTCKKADGPTGGGRVAVTFATNGNVTTATIEGPPFAGTNVGGCVAAKFRGAHVPPFGGGTVTVHKSFTIN